ncbi:hypothetical protein H0266_11150 [Halobacillus locisalis]|uniref:DNA2/NAM7 helicase-like C-terminal domain-containing protein n=1 Tax=Halobacillus locisalis TaxID=220753 RepID=A0A838CTY8_9BACI|nr:AAA domain-containing protein [Halobacillus locisalis]MBA2175450.1 hypothetical protein [Halobacillus locisalis]
MQMIEYLKNSLIDSERFATKYTDIQDEAYIISREDLQSGNVSKELLNNLPQQEIDVLINPVRLKKKHQHMTDEMIAPLWIPALLNQDGHLSPHPRDLPWMSVYYLFPSRTGESSIGYVEEYEMFYEDRTLTLENWDECWDFSQQLFEQITGYSFDGFSHDSYTLLEGAALSINPQGTNRKQGFISVLDDLQNTPADEHPLMFRAFTNLEKTEKQLLDRPETFITQHKRHLGHMSATSPLSTSQRQALYYFFEEEEGSTFAINGPPGTGKSMLLNCIVASSWVERALEQSEPDFLVASAIDHFTSLDLAHQYKADHDSGLTLAGRWIPDVDSYSLYATVDSMNVSSLPLFYQNDPSAYQKRLRDPDYVKKAEDSFLSHYETYAGQKLASVEEATSAIHEELQALCDDMQNAFSIVEKENESDVELWMREQTGESGSTEDMLHYLDIQHRYQAFLLASHYWEGRWIIEAKKGQNEPYSLHHDIKFLSKLTPLIVMPSLHMPYFFTEGENFERPVYDRIDWLMIEEAGQMLPELAPIMAAFTKSLIAVGDIHQVKPQWNITKTFDVVNVLNSGWTENSPEKFFNSGIASSNGSALLIAQRLSKHQVHPDIGGVFLTEHRRSVPEVIEYCNQLIYKSWLTPIRESIADYPFSHLGIQHTEGEVTHHQAGLSNEKEAETVVQWILDHKDKLKEYYERKRVENIIAIITPFPEQKQLLENKLSERELNRVTVGTIHMMQGSSSPVVLFSPVYQDNQSKVLSFDEDETLLNVAVSRAKESFLVFGNQQIFNPDSNLPSGLLARLADNS